MNKSKFVKILTVMTGVIGISTGYAINGVFDYGYGQINRGMGGAGIAMPQDAYATTINPAGMSQIKHNFDAGVAVYFPMMYADYSPGTAGFIPDVKPLAGAPGKHDSEMPVFVMPDIAYIFHLDKLNHVGISANSIGGFGSKYQTDKNASVFVPPPGGPAVAPAHGLFGDGTVYSSLKIGTLNASYNRVVNKYVSLGATLSYYVQAFESRGSAGLGAFTTRSLLAGVGVPPSVAAPDISNNGTDYNHGVSGTLAALVQPLSNVTLAFTATPPVRMTKMREYRDLLVNNGELDIPGRYAAGIRYQANDRLDLVADVVRIMNSDVDTYHNDTRALFDGRCAPGSPTVVASSCMGGKNGPGFGWDNQTLIKLGGSYKFNSRDTLRLGFSYGNQIGHSKDIIIQTFAPGSAAKFIASAGYSRLMKDFKLNSFLTLIPKQTLSGYNELSAGNAQKIEVSVSGIGLGLGVSM